jgi:hypothetical protein
MRRLFNKDNGAGSSLIFHKRPRIKILKENVWKRFIWMVTVLEIRFVTVLGQKSSGFLSKPYRVREHADWHIFHKSYLPCLRVKGKKRQLIGQINQEPSGLFGVYKN